MSPGNVPQNRYAEINGQRLHYKVWSESGAPLVLLHGVTGSADTWDAIAPQFANDYQVVAVDLRGHGESSKPPNGYTWAGHYAADIVEFVAGQSREPVILVGHSLGAMVAPVVAVRAPDRVRAIVMEDPPAFGPTEDPRATSDQFKPVLALKQMPRELRVDSFMERMGLSRARAEKRADELGAMSEQVLVELIEGGTAYKPEDLFPEVTCPTLIILGNPQRGGVVAFDDRPRLERLLRGAMLVDWGDVGHSIHSEQPERFVAEVREFLSGLPS